MYQQIKPTEKFRERELALMKERQNRPLHLGRRVGARREPKARNTIAAVIVALLGALVVASLMLAASSSPAHAASTTTTFLVNSTADQPDADTTDGKCFALNASCTLRAAIQQANATPGADVIEFAISGGEVHTITPSSPLPTITEDVTIDGYTQSGASRNTLAKGTNAQPKIELDGSAIPTTSRTSTGLEILGTRAVIRGLVIHSFRVGVSVIGGAQGVIIEGNFIGTDPTGTLDEGNSSAGILIAGGSTSFTSVGSPLPEARNLISGNDGNGVSIGFARSTDVSDNLIGTDRSGTKPLGNSGAGVDIGTALETNVQRSTIAFNGSSGVVVEFGGGANAIHNNSIFSNDGLGIDLRPDSASGPIAGKTPNDGDDPNTPEVDPDSDSGANGLQNFPVLSSAKTVSGETTIKGKLNSEPDQKFTIQFFSNPSGNEGKKFIGETRVSTDALGNASFTFKPSKKVAVGRKITATATSAGTVRRSPLTAGGAEEVLALVNTSEFAAPRKVVAS